MHKLPGCQHSFRTCANQLSACLILFFLLQTASHTQASSLLVSVGASTRLPDEVEADYQSAHLFINEVAGDNVPITLFFDPMANNVAAAEIFSNLNRRDRANLDANGDGIQDGIAPPSANSIGAGDDHNYYKAYSMQAVAGGFQLTLSAAKCGAYRLTARYRLENDPPGTYHWYNDERGANGLLKRDCAIVVSPKRARDLQLYEINPLTIAARGVTPDQRGTFSALTTETSSEGGSLFNLSYVKALGCRTLWLQPIHPRGIAGRGNDPTTSQPYELGSPYSVKNFFAVMPLMARPATADRPLHTATPRKAGRKQWPNSRILCIGRMRPRSISCWTPPLIIRLRMSN